MSLIREYREEDAVALRECLFELQESGALTLYENYGFEPRLLELTKRL